MRAIKREAYYIANPTNTREKELVVPVSSIFHIGPLNPPTRNDRQKVNNDCYTHPSWTLEEETTTTSSSPFFNQ
jgi:hypothetical protein